MTTIGLAYIRTDGGTQARAGIRDETVIEYAEALERGDTFPPLVVFHDGSDYWLADGFHRHAAFARAIIDDVPVEIRQGSRRDAVLHGAGANATHGLRRTNEDKRRAVQTLLNDREWSEWSDREIGRACGVSHTFVSGLRQSGNRCHGGDNDLRKKEKGRRYRTRDGGEAVRRIRPDSKPNSDIGHDDAPDIAAPAAEFQAEPSMWRKGLSGLTRAGLEDEVIGLREENAELRAALKAEKAKRKALNAQLADLTADDKSEVIRRQQQQIKHLQSEMYRANEAARVKTVAARKAQDEVKTLRRQLEEQEITL